MASALRIRAQRQHLVLYMYMRENIRNNFADSGFPCNHRRVMFRASDLNLIKQINYFGKEMIVM